MHKPFYSNQKEMWEPLSYNIFIAGLFLNPLAFENSRRSVVQSPAPSVSNLKWPWTVNVLWSHKCCTKACHQTGCFFVIINKWTSNPTWVNIKEKNVSMYENPLIEKWLVFLVKIWKCKFLYPWKITWLWGTNVRCFCFFFFTDVTKTVGIIFNPQMLFTTNCNKVDEHLKRTHTQHLSHTC